MWKRQIGRTREQKYDILLILEKAAIRWSVPRRLVSTAFDPVRSPPPHLTLPFQVLTHSSLSSLGLWRMYFSGQMYLANDSFMILQPAQRSRSDSDVVPSAQLTLSLWGSPASRQQSDTSNVCLMYHEAQKQEQKRKKNKFFSEINGGEMASF